VATRDSSAESFGLTEQREYALDFQLVRNRVEILAGTSKGTTFKEEVGNLRIEFQEVLHTTSPAATTSFRFTNNLRRRNREKLYVAEGGTGKEDDPASVSRKASPAKPPGVNRLPLGTALRIFLASSAGFGVLIFFDPLSDEGRERLSVFGIRLWRCAVHAD
jgi:hypothetical protein